MKLLMKEQYILDIKMSEKEESELKKLDRFQKTMKELEKFQERLDDLENPMNIETLQACLGHLNYIVRELVDQTRTSQNNLIMILGLDKKKMKENYKKLQKDFEGFYS